MKAALENLLRLGCIDKPTREITRLGVQGSRYPVNVPMAIVLMNSEKSEFNCYDQIVTLSAILSVHHIFRAPADEDGKKDAKARWKALYNLEREHLTARAWCQANYIYLSYMELQNAAMVRQDIWAETAGTRDVEDPYDLQDRNMRCLLTGHFLQVACTGQRGQHDTVYGTSAKLKKDIFRHNHEPRWILYHDIRKIPEIVDIFSIASKIDPAWLKELRPDYFAINRVEWQKSSPWRQVLLRSRFMITASMYSWRDQGRALCADRESNDAH